MRFAFRTLAVAVLLCGTAYAAVQAPAAGSINAWTPELEAGSMKYKAFRSAAIQSDCAYLLYLPPDYAANPVRRYPVVYWLHGLGGNAAAARPVVERLDAAIRAGKAPAMIIVSCNDPTGRSMWCDTTDGRWPVETVIVRDLIPHIDATYRAIAQREGRGLEGFSMGGLGSVRLGFKYPETFGTISVLATAMPTAEMLRDSFKPIYDQVFAGNFEACRAEMPWALAPRHAAAVRGRTRIRIHAGANDPLRAGCEKFHALLDELQIEHEFGRIPDAGHNLQEMLDHFPTDFFAFYREAFRPL